MVCSDGWMAWPGGGMAAYHEFEFHGLDRVLTTQSVSRSFVVSLYGS